MIQVGIDLVQISRIHSLINRKSLKALTRILHPNELVDFHNLDQNIPKQIQNTKSQNYTVKHAQFVSVRWALKEALFKALSEQEQELFVMNQWERINISKKPTLINQNYLIRNPSHIIQASVSHDAGLVAAYVSIYTK